MSSAYVNVEYPRKGIVSAKKGQTTRCVSLGRSGYVRTSGVLISAETRVRVQTINSRGDPSTCYIEIHPDSVMDVVDALVEVYNYLEERRRDEKDP